MKRVLKFLFLIMVSFAFSSCNEEETPTETSEISMTHISCLDQNDKEITSIDYVIDQVDYIYKNVKVYAYYSDGSSGNVTPFVTFSEIDLSTVGEKKVEVRYKGFLDTLTVNVTKIEVKRIEIDDTNVKKVYSINDWLDTSKLKVYKALSNSEIIEFDDYSLSIIHSSGEELSSKQLIYPGDYQVLISYNGKFSSFDVYAYDNKFDYMISSDINEIDFNEDGKYMLMDNELIFNNENLSISAYNGVLINKFYNNNPLEYIFADFCYLNTYDLVEESGFVINAKKDFEVVMIIDEDDSLLITDSEDNMIEHLSFEFGDDKFVTFSGSSGIYNINSLGDVKIKAMAINILGYKSYEDIIVDTSNVKTSYLVGENFTYDGLKLYYKYDDINTESIDVASCDINLYLNDTIVSELSLSGVYKVVIKFKDINGTLKELSYNIVVNRTSVVNKLVLDLSNVKLEFNKDDIFSTNGLKVYHVTNDSKTEISLKNCSIKLYYNDGKETYLVSNFVVIPGTYYVEVLYVNGSISLMETYDITYDSGAKIYEKDADVSITKLNDNSIEISVSNYVESIVDFNILIYENDKLFTTLSTFHFVISNIDVNKKYEIKGYYTGKINDQLYIIYVDQSL